MKLTSFILATICVAACGNTIDKSSSIVVKAVLSIIENYFVKGYPQVNLLVLVCGEKFGPSETLANEILRHKKDKVKSQVDSIQVLMQNERFSLETSTIILFDSAERFKQMVGKIVWLTNEGRRYRHLVYIPGVMSSDITKIKNGFLFDQVNFLMHESPQSIELVASYMFTAQKCRENQLIVVNRFMKNLSKWEGSTFYPKKYQNLHNCSLTHWATEEDYYENEQFFNQWLLLELENWHNFKVEFRPPQLSKALPPLSQFDLIIGSFFEDRKFFIDPGSREKVTLIKSVVTGSSKVMFLAPPGEPYTALEKMYIMFDDETWIAIGLTFMFSVIVILVVNKCSAKVQNVFYGHNIRTPFVNLIDIFLNGGQMKVPSRHFARILLILFVTWSLIIRTCYQSKMFEFLQADMRKKSVQSIDDLVERNFTLIGPEHRFAGHKDQLPEALYKLNFEPYSDDIMNRQETHDESYIKYYMNFVTEPEHRSTMLLYEDYYDEICRWEYRGGLPSLVMLEENVFTFYFSYQMMSFNPFFEEFNENIGKFNSNGLNAKWVAEYKNPNGFPNYYDDEVGAQVLTFEHLETCFLVCMVPAVLATIAFIIEISIPRVKAFNKFLREALVFWFTVRAFVRSNQRSNASGSNVLLANELRLQRVEILEQTLSIDDVFGELVAPLNCFTMSRNRLAINSLVNTPMEALGEINC